MAQWLALCAGLLLVSPTWSLPAMKIAASTGLESLYPLVSAIYNELGFQVEFYEMPNERAMVEVEQGHFDAEIGRIAGVLGPYPNLIQTNETLLAIDLVAWTAKGSKLKVRGPKDLKNRPVGILLGSKLSETYAVLSSIPVVKLPTQEQLAAMLRSGRLEVVLLISAFSNSPVHPVAQQAARLASQPVYHVLNHSYASLVPRFDVILRAMKQDGRYLSLTKGTM